jgi:4-hydroxy-tetrahydrodipicolinate reductase
MKSYCANAPVLSTDWENADVAIDFSVPDAAVGNISACLNSKVPVVSGTTGWLDQYEKMTALCDETGCVHLRIEL